MHIVVRSILCHNVLNLLRNTVADCRALPGKNISPVKRWGNRFNYHLGRSITYAILGAVVGVIGAGIELFTWQRSVAIVGGLLMVLLVFLPGIARKLKAGSLLSKELNQARQQLFGRLRNSEWWAWTGLGALNSLLPCGPLYIALAGALTTGTWAGGALSMMLFGAGTAVMLMVLHIVRDQLPAAGNRLAFVLPWITAAVGVLLILRGLDLGIPFISPSFNFAEGSVAGCH